MVCYSTLGSGQGELIDKVTEALKIANELRPELAIDGEFQLDAAIVPAVAEKKVKRESKVAGKANILIWPDLNVGNTAVKLIQQFVMRMHMDRCSRDLTVLYVTAQEEHR